MPTLPYPTTLPPSLQQPPEPAAAKDPRWVMLNLRGRRMDNSFIADSKTVAGSRTRFPGRQHLRVSLGGAAPPASSFLYYDFPDSVPGEDEDDDYVDIRVDVVAAHTDSVLLRMGSQHCPSAAFEDNDYFVYSEGAAGPRSLSLLPDRDVLTKTEGVYAHRPRLYRGSTGLLRRGDNRSTCGTIAMRDGRWSSSVCSAPARRHRHAPVGAHGANAHSSG